MQHFDNGSEGNFEGPVPPDTFKLLMSAGIVAKEVVVEKVAVCMGPGCPTYSGLHFAMILRRDMARAARLGFEESSGPKQ